MRREHGGSGGSAAGTVSARYRPPRVPCYGSSPTRSAAATPLAPSPRLSDKELRKEIEVEATQRQI